MMRASRSSLLPLLVAGLAACGGGGGGDDPGGGGGGAYSYVQTPTAVTAANQTQVAQATLGGGLVVANAQPLASSGRRAALAARGSPTVSPAAMLGQTANRVLGAAVGRASASPLAGPRRGTLAASTTTETCGVSGSVATTIDDRDDNGTLSSGDAIVVGFAQCSEGAGDLLNGTVSLTIASFSANSPSAASFSGGMSFDNVTSRLGSTSAVIFGTATVDVAFDDDTVALTITVGSAGLTESLTTPSFSDDIAFGPGMRISFLDSLSDGYASIWIDGPLSARAIGGSVLVATVTQFIQTDTEAYTSTGQAVITGANGSRIRLTVIDVTQVRLDLDADGDGSYEATQTVPWTSLVPSA
jgi:hypothetical protein